MCYRQGEYDGLTVSFARGSFARLHDVDRGATAALSRCMAQPVLGIR